MKRNIFVLLLAVLSLNASAQVGKGLRVGFEVEGGLSKYSGDGCSNAFVYGIPVVLEYNFSEHLYLSSGIGFALRGTKGDNLEGSLKSYNAQVPFNIGGRIPLGGNIYLFGQAGPYVSYALKKAEIEILGYGTKKSEAFNWGFNGKVGVEFSSIQVFGGYEYGMKDMFNGGDGKNRTIVFGAAYMF